ncbi:MAG TPA: GH92 family glycosyl hydrolase [Firmicutes bacterium]|nr:GH92 family glycosyl hydrolase [Bacillota bacterium]
MKKRTFRSKIAASVLAAAMVLPSVLQCASGITALAATPHDDYENGTKKIQWSTSFEEDEAVMEGFQESISEEGERATENIRDLDSALKLKGDITDSVLLDNLSGSELYNDREVYANLFDSNSGTKFYTRANRPTADNPIWVEFELETAQVIKIYALTSANDSKGRDPKDWTLLASNDEGEEKEWVALDTQEDQEFASRFQQNVYEIPDNEVAYKYYRLEVTENYSDGSENQLADLSLATGIEDPGSIKEMMITRVGSGPADAWAQSDNVGWSGAGALEVSGSMMGENAYASNILFDNVDVTVEDNTYLSYVLCPDLVSNYDYDYTQMYMAIDLKFDDGTYLSELAAKDQNGTQMTAAAQGESRILTTSQWNQIYSKIGDVAAGKTIDQILVVFDKDTMGDISYFRTWFDDIEIYTKDDTEYEHLSDYVYILRGTNDDPGFSRGLTAPAVTAPNGFNFWVPCTNYASTKTYDYQDTQLQYMSISHEASYWTGDRGTWQFMVNTSIEPEKGAINQSSVRSEFSHDQEVAKAHYYSVDFDDFKANGDPANAAGARMEVTATDHAGVVRATFDADTEYKNLVFDCVNAGGGLTFSEDGQSFTAYSDHTGNGSQRMYVYGEFSVAPTFTRVSGKQGIASFDTEEVVLYLATSYISEEQAQKNMELEVGGKTFDEVMAEAQGVWDDTLSIITDVEGATEEELISLYSSIYRLYMYPNNMSENTGTAEEPVWQYRSPYGEHEIEDGKIYINNGFWDTYRTTWAAYSLFTPNYDTELLNGLVEHYQSNGWVPRWVAPGGTNSMVGTSSDVVFGDAIEKGIEFNYEDAYKSTLRNSATVSSNLTGGGRKNLETSIFQGYVAGTSENFSWSIESYINDYGIAQMAKNLAEAETDPAKKAAYESEYQYYLNRAQNYALLFYQAGGEIDDMWLRGKEANGAWTTANNTDGEYDPVRWQGDYTETNGYNMSVSVPQDAQGLANLYGGRDALAAKIDSILIDYTPFSGYGAEGGNGGIHEQKEAREVKLGQLGHNNQPSHHILYMYDYAGQPWKAQYYVRDILKRCFVGSTFGQGYLGDEDNGEMSGWYIFSALGFYPTNMGSGEYTIGSPLFDSVTVNMDNGKQIKITANNNSDENVYIQSMTLNGEAYDKCYFSHEDLANGAEIVFNMGSTPNEEWGSSEDSLPSSITEGDEIPSPDMDATDSYTEAVDNAADVTTADAADDTLYGNIEGVAGLIDNTSGTEVALNGETTTLVYASDEGTKVTMVTLTSGKEEGTAPTAVKIYGAMKGGEWTELAAYDNLTFEWTQYTRPFAVNSAEAYNLYKIELTGGTSLAEVEFLAETEAVEPREQLVQLTEEAHSLSTDELDSEIKTLLDTQIAAAEAVLAKEDADLSEILDAYYALLDIVTRVNNIRDAYEKIEAERFSDKDSKIVDDGPNIGGVQRNTWASYEDIVFGEGTDYFEIYYSAQSSDAGGWVEVYLDDMENPDNLILTIEVPKTGSWRDYQLVSTAEVKEGITPGHHTVYLVFRNDGSHSYVCNVDWFRFDNTDPNAAAAVVDMINAIGEVTLDSEDAITAARAAYDALRDDTEKPLVTNRAVLEAAEEQLASYKEFENVYGDVSSENWSFYYIYDVYVKGLMSGYSNGNFGPYDTLVRGQFAMTLHRMEGEPEMEYQAIFPDVLEDDYYADAILWGVENKIITGYDTTGLFMPVRNIQRQELAVMMFRYANMKGYDTSARADYSGYKDADSVDAFAEEAMSWAVATGVISGKYNQTELDPQGNASREECATILSRFTDLYW